MKLLHDPSQCIHCDLDVALRDGEGRDHADDVALAGGDDDEALLAGAGRDGARVLQLNKRRIKCFAQTNPLSELLHHPAFNNPGLSHANTNSTTKC